MEVAHIRRVIAGGPEEPNPGAASANKPSASHRAYPDSLRSPARTTVSGGQPLKVGDKVACARRRRNTLRCEPWTTATVRVAAGYLRVMAMPVICQIGGDLCAAASTDDSVHRRPVAR